MVSSILSKFQDHGRDVPLLRGRMHYLSVCLYPILLKDLWNDQIPKEIKYSILIFFLCFILNFISTTLLHNNQTYIYRTVYKRMDYASIFLLISVISLPINIFYIDKDKVMAFLTSIQWIISFTGVFGCLVFDFCCFGKEIRSLVHLIMSLPNVYVLYRIFVSGPKLAIVGVILSFIINILGALVYCKEGPNLLAGIFEHHELFHCFCILALGAIMITNDIVITSKLN